MDAYSVKIVVRHDQYGLNHGMTDDIERCKIDNQNDNNFIYASINFLEVKEYRKWILSKEYKKLEEKYLEIVNQLGYLKDQDVSLCIIFGCYDKNAEKLQLKMEREAIQLLNKKLKKVGITIYKTLPVPYAGMKMYETIFFETNRQLKEYKENGMIDYIKEEFIEILDKIGYTKKFIDGVDIEFDSDENVKRNYEGNYFYRSRG